MLFFPFVSLDLLLDIDISLICRYRYIFTCCFSFHFHHGIFFFLLLFLCAVFICRLTIYALRGEFFSFFIYILSLFIYIFMFSLSIYQIYGYSRNSKHEMKCMSYLFRFIDTHTYIAMKKKKTNKQQSVGICAWY